MSHGADLEDTMMNAGDRDVLQRHLWISGLTCLALAAGFLAPLPALDEMVNHGRLARATSGIAVPGLSGSSILASIIVWAPLLIPEQTMSVATVGWAVPLLIESLPNLSLLIGTTDKIGWDNVVDALAPELAA
jgi:hypothetical protein